MILRLALALLVFDAPVAAQTSPPQPGTYEGVIVSVDTTLGATYSPTMGVTLQPQPQLQVQPSPFGPLILNGDGSYAMPVLDYTGEWVFDEGQGGIAFTGPLADAAPRLTEGSEAPVISLTLQGPQGDEFFADYSLVQGATTEPAPAPADMDWLNGAYTGLFAFHDGTAVRHLDVRTGEILKSYEIGAGGYTNSGGLAVHVLPDQIVLFAPDASPATAIPIGPDWQAGNFWLGEASPDGKRMVLNGGSLDGKPADPVKDAAFAVIDMTGAELRVHPAGGGYSAGWLDDDRLYFQPKAGGLSILDLRDGSETVVKDGPVEDAAAAPGGSRILIRQGETLSVADFERAETIAVPGSFTDVLALRFAPDGRNFVLAVLRGGKVGFDIVTPQGKVTPLRHAGGDMVFAATTLGGWWQP